MTITEKLIKIAENIPKNVEYGKSLGGGGEDAKILLDNMRILDGQWQHAVFPEGYNFVMDFKKLPNTLNSILMNTTGVKTAKLICNESGAIVFSGAVRGSTVEVFDITEFKPIPTNINYFALTNSKLVSVLGEIDMTSCITATNSFNGATALEEIRFKEGTISIALNFSACKNLVAKSYDSIIKGHSKEAVVTLTLPAATIVRSTYDDFFGSGAWDTITAEYSNVTITYST